MILHNLPYKLHKKVRQLKQKYVCFLADDTTSRHFGTFWCGVHVEHALLCVGTENSFLQSRATVLFIRKPPSQYHTQLHEHGDYHGHSSAQPDLHSHNIH